MPPRRRTPSRAVESLRLRAADLTDTLTGRRDRFTPPRRLAHSIGDSDFRATGDEFLGLFQQLAGLRAEDRVLDIGCGIGRMARVLAGVLRPPGSYDGFDIGLEGIEWCRAHYLDTPAPFRFEHADLRNTVYNPSGTGEAETYAFPYADGSFDLVIATSLFTHLLPAAADNYLAEAARVLSTAGRLLSTWMLLDGEAEGFTFDERLAPAAVRDPAEPEAAVAYPSEWVRERLAACRFESVEVHRGSWHGGAGVTLQDVLLARGRR